MTFAERGGPRVDPLARHRSPRPRSIRQSPQHLNLERTPSREQRWTPSEERRSGLDDNQRHDAWNRLSPETQDCDRAVSTLSTRSEGHEELGEDFEPDASDTATANWEMEVPALAELEAALAEGGKS